MYIVIESVTAVQKSYWLGVYLFEVAMVYWVEEMDRIPKIAVWKIVWWWKLVLLFKALYRYSTFV